MIILPCAVTLRRSEKFYTPSTDPHMHESYKGRMFSKPQRLDRASKGQDTRQEVCTNHATRVSTTYLEYKKWTESGVSPPLLFLDCAVHSCHR